MSSEITAIRDTEAVESTELTIAIPEIPSIALRNVEWFRAKIAQLEALFSGYDDGVTVDAKTYAQAKKERAWLRNVQKSVDQKRKDAKAAYMKPVDDLAELLKAETESVERYIEIIDAAVKDFEDTEKVEKLNAIREHYYSFGGFLADAIDPEVVFDPKWSNRSVTLEKAKSELEEKLIRIKDELDSLDMLSLAYGDEARAEYYATIDFARAIARDKELYDRAERAKEEKAARDAYNQATQRTLYDAEAEAQARASSEPVNDAVAAAERAQAACAARDGIDPVDRARNWTIHIRATRREVERLAGIIKESGITGGRISADE